MIRPLTIVTFLMACGSGLYLYQAKHAAQVLDRDIEHTVRDTQALREQSRLLAAEWTMLNDPETLRRFSDQYLQLKSIAPTQFTSLTDLKGRLPPVQINTPSAGPAETTDEDADAPAISDAAPPAAEPPPPAVAAKPAAEPAPPPVAARPAPAPAVAAKESPRPVPPVVAAKPPAEHAIEHAVERKVAAAPKPVAPPIQAARASEPRQTEPRQTEPRVADSRPVEPRPVAAPAPVARPAVIAASAPARHAPVPAPAYIPAASPATPAPAPAPYSGSLLGMARTSVPAPLPRPVPVSAAQWSNAN